MCKKGVLVNMKMSVFTNNQSGIPYTQYGTDKQKARATKFAQADNTELAHLANRINNRKERTRHLSFEFQVASNPSINVAVYGQRYRIGTRK